MQLCTKIACTKNERKLKKKHFKLYIKLLNILLHFSDIQY